ncbi:unnamed protein product [Adineta steineri]|uniref:Nucleotide-diphospho-sugar transferase domain-containing protein n=1 Tax=Adineta steineri TaxID=433720 RepID=A0A818Z535_9BILA
MAYRLHFLMRVLRLGYHFLSADIDSIWLSNPFEHIVQDTSITIQGQTHKEIKMSGGFVIVHATTQGRIFWQNIIDCQQQNLEYLRRQNGSQHKLGMSILTEQECINDRLNSTNKYLLDPYLFPDGRSFFDQQRPQSRGIVPVVIHGNWLVGLEPKVKRLLAWNLIAATANVCSPLESGIPYSSSHDNTRVHLRIRVLSYNRLKSLQRLLSSLLVANYLGDSVELEISIDRPSSNATAAAINEWKQLTAYMGDGVRNSSKFR